MMRFRYLLAIIFLAVVAFGTAGCKGEYYFDFAEEQALGNAKGEWTIRDYPDRSDFISEGLLMMDVNVACPKKFSGDFTLTVVFNLNTDIEHRYNFGIILCDGDFYFDSKNELHMDFYNAGGITKTFTIIEDDGAGGSKNHDLDAGVNTSILFSELHYQEENTWVVSKKGDIITISVNAVQFAEFTLDTYNSQWFCPNIYATSLDMSYSEYGLTLKTVLMEYDGSMVNR